MSIPSKILVRNDSAANWASANPVLGAGEPAWVTDSKLFTVGDGVLTFAALPKFKNAAQVDAAVATAQGAATAASASAIAVAAALASLSPTVLAAPGALVMFPCTAAPPGYLKANGATGLLRADFPGLWAFIVSSGLLAASEGAKQPHQFGPGNGTTTFSLIDARGYALRAWDDGRGVDAGRGIGTYQADQIKDHAHGAAVTAAGTHSHFVNDPGHDHGVSDPGHVHGVNDPGHSHNLGDSFGLSNAAGDGLGFTNGIEQRANTISASGTGVSIQGNTTGVDIQRSGTGISLNSDGNHSHTVNVYGINSGGVGAETRMKNVAYLLCIKF